MGFSLKKAAGFATGGAVGETPSYMQGSGSLTKGFIGGTLGGLAGSAFGGGIGSIGLGTTGFMKGVLGDVPQLGYDDAWYRQQVADLEKRRKEAKELVAKTDIELKEEEEALKKDLSSQRLQREGLLASELQRRIEGLGYEADITRQQVGAAYGAKGLTRSTFAQRGIEDVSLAELEQKGLARSRVAGEIERGRDIERRTFKQIDVGRKRREQQRQLEEIQQTTQQIFALDTANIQRQFQTDLANIQLESQYKQALYTGVGGIIGSIFNIGALAGGGSAMKGA